MRRFRRVLPAIVAVLTLAAVGNAAALGYVVWHQDRVEKARAAEQANAIAPVVIDNTNYDNSSALAVGALQGRVEKLEHVVGQARADAKDAHVEADKANEKHHNLCIIHSIC